MAEQARPPQKPLLRIRSHFSPLLVVYHHPVRLAVSLAIPVMLLPELRGFIQAHWHLGLQEARLAAVLGILLVVFLPQLLASALNCRSVVFSFYSDHVEFTESFLVRETIKMSYGAVQGAEMQAGFMQRFVGVADILLVLRGRTGHKDRPQQLRQAIPDVRNAQAVLGEVRKILQAQAPRA